MFFIGGEYGHGAGNFDEIVDWSDSKLTKPYFKSLIDIRKTYLLSNAVLTRLTNSLPTTVYSYKTESSKGSIVTLLNFSSNPAEGTIDLSNEVVSGADDYLIRNLLTNSQEIVDVNALSIIGFSLAGYDAIILTISPN